MKMILLAIMFCLVPNIANAEGSWVLWEGTTELGLPCEWKIVAAYPKYEQCIERQKKDFEIIKKNFGVFKIQILSPETMVIEKLHSNTALGDVIITQKCLPDTIDPRK
jgi:hypothetical protein